MRNLISRNINGKKVLFLFVLTNIIYLTMILITIPKVVRFSGGMRILDMLPAGYNAEYVNALLNALGENGRNAYLYNQIPIDMIYTFFSGLTYCLLIAYFLNKLGKLNGYFFAICFLPLLAGFFDYCENTGIIFMLRSYPDNSVLLSQITNVFSVLKSSFTTIYFFILMILLIACGINKLQQKWK